MQTRSDLGIGKRIPRMWRMCVFWVWRGEFRQSSGEKMVSGIERAGVMLPWFKVVGWILQSLTYRMVSFSSCYLPNSRHQTIFRSSNFLQPLLHCQFPSQTKSKRYLLTARRSTNILHVVQLLLESCWKSSTHCPVCNLQGLHEGRAISYYWVNRSVLECLLKMPE